MTQVPPSQNAAELFAGNDSPLLNEESVHKLVDTPLEAVTPQPVVMPTSQVAPVPVTEAPQVAVDQAKSHTANDDFFDLLYEKLKSKSIFDGRNIYNKAKLLSEGWSYFGIGR